MSIITSCRFPWLLADDLLWIGESERNVPFKESLGLVIPARSLRRCTLVLGHKEGAEGCQCCHDKTNFGREELPVDLPDNINDSAIVQTGSTY